MDAGGVRGDGGRCRSRTWGIDAGSADLIAREVIEPDARIEDPLLGQVDRISEIGADGVDGRVVDLALARDDGVVTIRVRDRQAVEAHWNRCRGWRDRVSVPVDRLARDLDAGHHGVVEGAGIE